MRYMLLGEKEKANHLVKEQMVDFLSKSMENIGYYSSDKKSFVESSRVSKFMEEKLGQAKQTGIELPEHLKTAEAFWEYYKEMAKV